MFPESFRNFVCATTDLTIKGTKKLYSFGGSALWIISTSFTVLALPLIFEVERAQAEEAEKQQQRQVSVKEAPRFSSSRYYRQRLGM